MAGLTEPKVCDKDIPVYGWENGKQVQTGTKKCGQKAKDAKGDIDIDNIMTQCDELKGYAEDVRSIKNQVTACTDLIGTQELSINGTGIGNLVDNFTATADTQAQNISDLADKTKEDAIAAFNAKQAGYNANLPCGHN